MQSVIKLIVFILATQVMTTSKCSGQLFPGVDEIPVDYPGFSPSFMDLNYIAADVYGNIYATVNSGGPYPKSLLKVTPDGVVTVLLDTGLNNPGEVAVGPSGNVYVADRNTDNVHRVRPNGQSDIIANIEYPSDVKVDSNDNVFVSSTFGDSLIKITPDGTINTLISASGDGLGNTLSHPHGVAVGPDDSVYVASSGTNTVFRVTPDGVVSAILTSNGNGQGQGLNNPTHVAVDTDNNVFITGSGSSNVFKITPDGVIKVVASHPSTTSGQGIIGPHSIAVDREGTVYLTGSSSFNDIQLYRIKRDQEIEALFTPFFGLFWALASDPRGNIYFSPILHHRIFRINSTLELDFIRGDCNLDSALEISDAILSLAYLFNSEPADCLDSCDSNDDGRIDIGDPIYLLTNLFSQGQAIPEPTQSCAADPTLDLLLCEVNPSCP